MTARGTLRIYLGASPGVGKTYAMLDEGWRRTQRGTDVVIGIVETHNRRRTAEQIRDLEVVPRRRIEYRGAVLEEMDVDAVLARRPRVALVDELAHTNAPGSRNEKRWQDIEELLDAGIDVISTVNIQHLESLNDVIARITGITQRETVPDAFVRDADQIELVDMTPEALRRRMAHGNIYPAERIDAALANYFRPGNLSALRELALLWVADRVEDSLQHYLADHGISEPWETRERVVVTITGAPSGDNLIRRAARMAGRHHGDLLGVRVISSDGRAASGEDGVARQRRLLAEMGGTYHEVVGDDIATALTDFARAEKATQLIVGAGPRSLRHRLTQGSIVNRLLERIDGVDVHVIAAKADVVAAPPSKARPAWSPLPVRRQLAAWLLLAVGTAGLTAILVPLRDSLSIATVTELFLALVVAVAAVGGLVPGLTGSLVASLSLNWFFTPPFGTLTIAEPENVTSLLVFVALAVLVSYIVDRSARRSLDAQRARAEAEALARTTAELVNADDPLPGLVEHLRSTMNADAVAVLGEEDGQWLVVAASGNPVPATPAAGTAFELNTDEGLGRHVLVLVGRAPDAASQRVLRTLTGQMTVALGARELQRVAREADLVSHADRVRTALLQAVSHDLRTPLAAIKAYVTGLRRRDVTWSSADIDEALAAVDAECDRLNQLVGNLLDASRLQVGALAVSLRPAAVEEVVGRLLAVPGNEAVLSAIADDLPLVETDPALLERALANLLSNAARHNPVGATPVRVEAAQVGDNVHVRVVDHGPGIPPSERERVFQPFQRLGDDAAGNGVGLGLAITRGFVDAVGATLEVDDTPGGGLTVTLQLPVSETLEGAAP